MNVLTKAKDLYQREFVISRSLIVISSILFGNLFSYLFQLLLGRHLSVEDYGNLLSLFALSGVIPLFTVFITGGLIKLVAEIKDVNYPTKISALFTTLLKIHIALAVGIFFIILITQDFTVSYLKIVHKDVMLPFAFAIAAGMFVSFTPMFLQGLLRFKAYSAVQLTSAFTKFLVCISVISYWLGLDPISWGSGIIGIGGLNQVFWGLGITTFGVGALAFLFLQKNIRWINTFDVQDLKLLFKYSIGGAIAQITISLLQNTDLLLAKHYFDPTLAGIYGSTSVIGRIVFFAASPVALVMLPICAEKYRKGADFKTPFLLSMAMTVFISLSVTFVYYVSPNLIIKTIFLGSEKYIPAGPYIYLYAVFMMLYAILVMLISFLIATSKFKLASLSILSAIIQATGLILFHDSINEILYVSIFSVGVVSLLYIKPIYQILYTVKDKG